MVALGREHDRAAQGHHLLARPARHVNLEVLPLALGDCVVEGRGRLDQRELDRRAGGEHATGRGEVDQVHHEHHDREAHGDQELGRHHTEKDTVTVKRSGLRGNG